MSKKNNNKSKNNRKNWAAITGLSIGMKIFAFTLISLTLLSIIITLYLNISININTKIYIDTNTIKENKIKENINFYC